MWAWLGGLAQGILSAMASFFTPLLQFVAGFIYLLERIIQLAGLVVQVVLLLIQILASVFAGIIATFQGLASATPTPTTIPQLAPAFAVVTQVLDPLGFQVLGELLAAVVWIAFGLAVIQAFRRL